MGVVRFLANGIRKINLFLSGSGAFAALFILLITLGDVSGRYFLNKPILDTFELCGLATVVMVGFYLAPTEAVQGHVSIDFVFARFPNRAQRILDVIASLLGLALAVLLAAGAMSFALDSQASGESVGTMRIPQYPFKFVIFLGAVALSLQLIVGLVGRCRRAFGGQGRGNIS